MFSSKKLMFSSVSAMVPTPTPVPPTPTPVPPLPTIGSSKIYNHSYTDANNETYYYIDYYWSPPKNTGNLSVDYVIEFRSSSTIDFRENPETDSVPWIAYDNPSLAPLVRGSRKFALSSGNDIPNLYWQVRKKNVVGGSDSIWIYDYLPIVYSSGPTAIENSDSTNCITFLNSSAMPNTTLGPGLKKITIPIHSYFGLDNISGTVVSFATNAPLGAYLKYQLSDNSDRPLARREAAPANPNVYAIDTRHLCNNKIYVELFDGDSPDYQKTPETVANFLEYVSSEIGNLPYYQDTFIHESVRMPSHRLPEGASDPSHPFYQYGPSAWHSYISGGTYTKPSLPADYGDSADPVRIPITHTTYNPAFTSTTPKEQGNSNRRGTLGMFRNFTTMGKEIPSNTWFFNVSDNTDFDTYYPPYININDNGLGYVVFGRIICPHGMRLIDALASPWPTYDASSYYQNLEQYPLTDLPIWKIGEDGVILPEDFLSINIQKINKQDLIIYEATTNNPSEVSVGIITNSNNQKILSLEVSEGATAGSCLVTVKAISLIDCTEAFENFTVYF